MIMKIFSPSTLSFKFLGVFSFFLESNLNDGEFVLKARNTESHFSCIVTFSLSSTFGWNLL